MRILLLPLVFLLSCVTHQAAVSPEPTLTLRAEAKTRTFTRTDLLHHPKLQDLTIEKDPTYKSGAHRYRAVPIAALFDGLKIEANETLYFTSLDGFSAPLSASRLLNTDARAAVAYLAVEDPSTPWPPLKPADGPATAGPFYLVWEHPERSKIGTEEWPFQVVSFEAKASIEALYPHVAPALTASESVKRGYHAFLQNCFACHTMNREGASQVGPDLNVPNNPTEYLGEKFLWKQIRDPQSVKYWPQGRMPGFKVEALPDDDVRDIIQYLAHMTGRKVR